ncbi:YifB family Mg chelatase-like AAA ATPase [Spirochaetota bacterium]
MYICLTSYTLYGLEAVPVSVEVSITPGLPRFEIIGLPDASIRECRERIFQSIKKYGYEIPPGCITVNLAPAEIRKKGALFDLPIAVGILLSSAQVQQNGHNFSNMLIAGELSLNGDVKKVNGVFNAGYTCIKKSLMLFMLPASNVNEIKYFKKLKIIPVTNLKEAVDYFEHSRIISNNGNNRMKKSSTQQVQNRDFDFSQIYGNEFAKKAIELALVARMNILLIGPPGCGKSMLIQRIPTICSKLTDQESIEVSRIYSAGGLLKQKIIEYPPFRQVHNTITPHALFGGGHSPLPGEISLSHNGVLFLDELSEFQRSVIQMLRQPMEDKKIVINRMNFTYSFPCNFILAAATNPCACGYYGDTNRICMCSPNTIARFYSRLSGPILDRIELILYISPPDDNIIFTDRNKSSEQMKKEMKGPLSFLKANSYYLSNRNIHKIMNSNQGIKRIIKDAYTKGFISLRRVKAIMKAALALALFDNKAVGEEQVYEAIQYCKFKWSI